MSYQKTYFRRADRIEPEKVSWLVPDLIPMANVTLIAGAPGEGKSQIALNIAGILSRGGAWPFALGEAKAGKSILVSLEDQAASVTVPRLIAAGAKLERIRLADDPALSGRPSDLLVLLERRLDKSDARLVIVDTLLAAAGVSPAKQVDLLNRLKALAEQKEIAIVCLTHLNKSKAQTLLARVQGSVTSTAVARSVLIVLRDHQGNKYLATSKLSYGPDDRAYGFSIVATELEDGVKTSRVEWESRSLRTLDIEETRRRPSESKIDALRFVGEFVKGKKEVLSSELLAEAAKEGITDRNARAAIRAHGYKKKHDGGTGAPWKWVHSDPNFQGKEIKRSLPPIEDYLNELVPAASPTRRWGRGALKKSKVPKKKKPWASKAKRQS